MEIASGSLPSNGVRVPWGRAEIEVEFPRGWRVSSLAPAPAEPLADIAAATRRALLEPIGSQGVFELADPEARVAVVVDDASRPTPVASVLPAVLAELERAGVPRSSITLVTALGLHRPMTDDEVAVRAGSSLVGLRFENHDCDDPSRLIDLGTTTRGTRVLVNRTVAEADLVVSIGCIEPHLIAGFGGGAKNIVPGVAGRETIGHNHALNTTPGTFDGVGRSPHESPMRLDLEEAASMLEPPVVLVNTVLNGELAAVRVVCGDLVQAHRKGVATSTEIFAVPLEAPADVVVTDSHPMDQDLRQGMKCIGNTIRAVRKGGVLIALIRAEEGVGEVGLAGGRKRLGPRALRLLAPALLRLVPRMPLRGMGEEDRFFLYFALQAMRRATLLLYAPTVPGEVRRGLPFAQFVESPEAAVARARSIVGTTASAVVFPDGGATYPIRVS